MIWGRRHTNEMRRSGFKAYLKDWGNYKSDVNKTKGIMRSQISDIMFYGSFTKKDLMIIRRFLEVKGFKEFM